MYPFKGNLNELIFSPFRWKTQGNDSAQACKEEEVGRKPYGAGNGLQRSSFPLAGQDKELTEELVRDGFIIPKPTGYGTQISLSVSRSEEIKSIIREYLRIEL
jgi:hypothetical protein